MRRSTMLVVGGLVLAAAVGVRAGGYNDAGCGVGAMLWNKNTKGQQILAATTNQYFGQAYSITTGTTGCEREDNRRTRRMERERFVASNLRSLSRDLAAGGGDFASSFASLMGCREEGVPAFVSFAKDNYGTLFPENGSTPAQVVRTVEAHIAATPGLSKLCSL